MTSPTLKPQKTLVDVTAAFTFSRLPIEQRIAKTLANIISNKVKPALENVSAPVTMDELFFEMVGIELAPYAAKQFVVRYGHLEDGNAKT